MSSGETEWVLAAANRCPLVKFVRSAVPAPSAVASLVRFSALVTCIAVSKQVGLPTSALRKEERISDRVELPFERRSTLGRRCHLSEALSPATYKLLALSGQSRLLESSMAFLCSLSRWHDVSEYPNLG